MSKILVLDRGETLAEQIRGLSDRFDEAPKITTCTRMKWVRVVHPASPATPSRCCAPRGKSDTTHSHICRPPVRAKITVKATANLPDVKSTLAIVESGEVDAGLVYVTDVRSADGQVQGVDFPEATAPGAAQNYLVGAVAGGQTDLANAWIQFVTGPQGDAALQQAGFTLK